jgi:hypothetical protein
MPPKRRTIAERFWPKVKKMPSNGCWLWMAGTRYGGYGVIGSGGHFGTMRAAHRVSWELHRGPIPEGLLVLHRCDTPLCVRPSHLFLGTQNDNITDCIRKGRKVNNYNFPKYRGADAPWSKLTIKDVLWLRRSVGRNGLTQEAAARKLGICQTQVSRILRRKRWAYLSEERSSE